jgi:hypothetical protein
MVTNCLSFLPSLLRFLTATKHYQPRAAACLIHDPVVLRQLMRDPVTRDACRVPPDPRQVLRPGADSALLNWLRDCASNGVSGPSRWACPAGEVPEWNQHWAT